MIKLFGFTERIFKKLKLYLEKKKLFYVDAGFKTKIRYFKHLKVINYYGVNVKIPIFFNSILLIYMGKIGKPQIKILLGKK